MNMLLSTCQSLWKTDILYYSFWRGYTPIDVCFPLWYWSSQLYSYRRQSSLDGAWDYRQDLVLIYYYLAFKELGQCWLVPTSTFQKSLQRSSSVS